MFVIYYDDVCEYVNNNKEYLIDLLNDIGDPISDEAIQQQAENEINEGSDNLKSTVQFFDNITKYNKIIVVASLGLWYGTRTVKKCFNSLYDALFNSRGVFQDVNKLFFKDKRGTLTLNAIHHDGVNVLKFYKIVNGKRCAIKYDEIEVCL